MGACLSGAVFHWQLSVSIKPACESPRTSSHLSPLHIPPTTTTTTTTTSSSSSSLHNLVSVCVSRRALARVSHLVAVQLFIFHTYHTDPTTLAPCTPSPTRTKQMPSTTQGLLRPTDAQHLQECMPSSSPKPDNLWATHTAIETCSPKQVINRRTSHRC